MEQTIEFVREITDRFREMVLMCPGVAGSERMRMSRYVFMSWNDIREFVRGTRCESLATMNEVSRERERELELETQSKKRKSSQTQIQTHTHT